ncbi:MAG TPA: LysR family transcriptional regulator, partial [Candidatus Halomonas stercoripullorum]|nr:LysR family transcriptional regulator [Candidatus Halomonas stercoripullorum]
MQPTIRQLKAFVAIVEFGSFVEASEHLHLSQPALSIAIRKLEEAVGGVLFNRSPRGVQLTPEGRFFLPMARRLIGDWEEALGDLGELFNKQRGKVTLAALPTLAAGFLPAVLADYRKRYPNIAISVHDTLANQVD